MKKLKYLPLFFAGIFLSSSFALAATDPVASQTEDAKLKAVREQLAEDAAYIQQVSNDPKMTPAQRKEKIAEFIRKQKDKV